MEPVWPITLTFSSAWIQLTWPWGGGRWRILTEAGVVGEGCFQPLTLLLQVTTASAGTT